MRSTFMGLETNKRGLYTQQSALYTTGHNISNANTDGYSRQRVNMTATSGFPGVGLNAGTMPGFLGTGVEAGSIQRIRDSFVDYQFRQESNKFGYWESRSKAISQMEDVLNEPSHYGLQKSLSQFWQSLQDLAVNPENAGAREVAVQNGVAVAESFNYMHKSLTEIQANLGKEIDTSVKNINSILEDIANLNNQIAQVEPNGYLPNDLYDARDLLIDELSNYLPIETDYEKSGGRALAIAEGSVTISLKLSDGTKVELVNRQNHATIGTNPGSLTDNNQNNLPINGLNITTIGGAIQSIEHENLINTGKIKSLMDSYGTANDDGSASGLYPDMLKNLDQMAAAFAEAFNEIHASGFPKAGLPSERTNNFFVSNTEGEAISASNLSVNRIIEQDSSLLRASSAMNEEGNGELAQQLADVQSKALGDLNGATAETFYQKVIGDLGVAGQQAERMMHNTGTLLGAVEHRRASISSVSLDEEMTDMIKFQQAYNASARMITVIDETLDRIINGMGRVGM